MPTPPLPDEVQTFLAKPNPSVVTTIRPDGQPVSVATWYLWENGRLLLGMDNGRKRVEYMRADPRVSLTVIDWDDWYTHVSLQGHVVEWEDDADLHVIDRISRHYTGGAYHDRERPRIAAWVEVDRWHGWGAQKATDNPEN